MTGMDAAQEALFELAGTPGETFTPEQSQQWKALRAKIRGEGYREALALLLNHKHWFEKEPHAMAGFMAVHNAFQTATEGATQ